MLKREILKISNKKIKVKYLACIWCGKENTTLPTAQYCSQKCENTAHGVYIK